MSDIEKLEFDHAQTLFILDLPLKKCFAWNIAKVSWENSKPFCSYQNFLSEEGMYMYTLPPFMDEVIDDDIAGKHHFFCWRYAKNYKKQPIWPYKAWKWL